MATEGDFSSNCDPGKMYFVRSSTLNRWKTLIRRGRPKSGVGITVDERDDGTVINKLGGDGGGGLGPLVFLGMKAGAPQYYKVNAQKIDPPADGAADSSP